MLAKYCNQKAILIIKKFFETFLWRNIKICFVTYFAFLSACSPKPLKFHNRYWYVGKVCNVDLVKNAGCFMNTNNNVHGHISIIKPNKSSGQHSAEKTKQPAASKTGLAWLDWKSILFSWAGSSTIFYCTSGWCSGVVSDGWCDHLLCPAILFGNTSAVEPWHNCIMAPNWTPGA